MTYKKKKNFYEIDFNVWMERFGITDPHEQYLMNQSIIEMVREREAGHREAREAKGRSVVGRRRLEDISVGAPYQPDRRGRRMLVHSVDREFRKKQIRWIRELIRVGREVLERWRQGDFSVSYPMGLFPPTGVRLVEPIGW